MPGKAAKVIISEKQQSILLRFSRSRTKSASLFQRSQIILLAFEGHNNETIESKVGLHHDAVGTWRRRWRDSWDKLIDIECNEAFHVLANEIEKLLSDSPRGGRKLRIDAQQQAALFKTACEVPEKKDCPIARWSGAELRRQLIEDKVVDSISSRWVNELLRRATIRPQKNKYWLTSKDKADPQYESRVGAVCQVYHEAIDLYHRKGVHTICIDEQTGIQALQRIAADHAVLPGKTALREYEYKRHGTTCLFGNLHVATGRILSPMLRETRTEEDFLENIDNLVVEDPEARFRLVSDNLTTHCSESLVRYVAYSCGIEEPLGKKGVRGILKSVKSRKAFLTDPSHRIQFYYTPRHCSWLNQIEIWFGILRSKVTRWMSFPSLDALEHAILNYIDYYNKNFAHPFAWTYTGKILTA